MSKSVEDFFTAGELATLFNIPKQRCFTMTE